MPLFLTSTVETHHAEDEDIEDVESLLSTATVETHHEEDEDIEDVESLLSTSTVETHHEEDEEDIEDVGSLLLTSTAETHHEEDIEDFESLLLTSTAETHHEEDIEDFESLFLTSTAETHLDEDEDIEDVEWLLSTPTAEAHFEDDDEDTEEVETLLAEIVQDFVEWSRQMDTGAAVTAKSAASTSCVEALERVRFQGREREEPQCAICLNEFWVGMEVVRMPCKHIFDGGCILQWLSMNHVCPLCRFELPRQTEDIG